MPTLGETLHTYAFSVSIIMLVLMVFLFLNSIFGLDLRNKVKDDLDDINDVSTEVEVRDAVRNAQEDLDSPGSTYNGMWIVGLILAIIGLILGAVAAWATWTGRAARKGITRAEYAKLAAKGTFEFEN
jgi:hypothetical protein